MDDNLSIKSNDSVTISGEYEMVIDELDAQTATLDASPSSPTLKIANNGNHNDLEKNLTEMIGELDVNASPASASASPKNVDILSNDMNMSLENASCRVALPNQMRPPSSSGKNDLAKPMPASLEMNKVGQSVFYDCLESSPTAEKQDDMKPEHSDTEEEMSEIDQDGTTFNGITSLGSSTINAPKSEIEIQRKMSELNANHKDDSLGMKVSVTIPSCHEGYVVLQDENSNTVIKRYEISRILFYARGPEGSADEACFAFTWQATHTVDSPVFQCHAFRCNIPEAVKQVSSCFAKAFQPIPASLTASITSTPADSNAMNASLVSDGGANAIGSVGYEFIVLLEIREKLNKNTYTAVSRDRSGFKLRCNADKEINITVNQVALSNAQSLYIERCFGVLMSPGKLVRQADMQLLDMVNMGYVKQNEQTTPPAATSLPYIVRAEWLAADKNFEQLNQESTKMYITVAIDLVIRAIQEPVRFVIETPVTIQSQSEMRLMDHFNFSAGKKSIAQRFYLQLKDNGEGSWEVSSIDPLEEIVEPVTSTMNSSSILRNLGINSFAKMTRSTSAVSIEDESPVDYSSDGDEPLLSGTGDVPTDCSQDKLNEWDPVIVEWDTGKRPKGLAPLVRLGIPDNFRGNIWQRLSGVDTTTSTMDMYRVLLTQETKCENVIQRDIHRTFPAHKFFSEIGGSGQDVLFKVSKAYAVYDKEVGYCQGLSFIAASLLLHMPEEEAFCVLVKLMYDYGLRDLYKDGFEILYLHLYQLNRLMKDQLPKLFEHFEQNGIETHMFASQWFLTLFTARFPLYLVFHILDVFLLDGLPILFQVALTLLTEFENELRMLDFEGILKYFRVTLPKRCRSVSLARKLMKKACERKVKKLKLYKDEFLAQKELAEKEEAAMKQYALKFEEERKQLRADVSSLRTKLEQTIEKSKQEEGRKTIIIDDYKRIIQRHEQQIVKLNEQLNDMTKTVSKCDTCSSAVTLNSSTETDGDGNETTASLKSVPSLGPLDPLENSMKQVKELELVLAQTKLELVEAQCCNQDLTHQMNTLIGEIQSNRNSWQPWLTKTINSIQEKVVSAKRDTPTFQSYTSNSPTPSYNSLERNVEPTSMCSNSSNTSVNSGRNTTKHETKTSHHNNNQ